MASKARYDAVADWYPSWVGDGGGLIAEDGGDLLPSTLRGSRVLDVACGHGRASRALARLGAVVVGVDISSELVASARAIEAAQPLGIGYRVADIAEPDQWWDGVPFDGAVCEMAFMDIDDLPGTLAAVAGTVRPGGWFVASLVHPCFPGNEEGLSSWPPDRSYFAEGWWTSTAHNPVGVRIRVGSSHRTLSSYLNALVDAGFSLEHVVEPPAPVPTFLLLRCRREDLPPHHSDGPAHEGCATD
jgi:2-polyprenyl-3-methyl-5-hydroxy-6-metoxy-1,4-benzoquinol methylase